ncbi:hypothetical protein ACKUB1_16385 [Methanospirillum stamsii]|uniref:Uncharacterized protein n=1 Tax=Methanospirillum stamsii TaxID=1277351 RepID=A0A2V2NHF0_9EURY|nr:hypothetical protein [Methanospirillum stamsii]PWR75031.1 hypothetical protein DLD82_07370 [Methanospirillum stamsii]
MTGEEPEYVEVTCQHCEGAGCCFCDTKGTVSVKWPEKMCRHCNGVGCIYCGYTGWGGLRGKYD